ncbi:MAG: protein phosphatase 2C domain-containing protein [Phormidesmis sp. CAN_BIN36]|nr:protein phosphatase 2C domain-containing protein [Phormidesmis sp. CAN_BIN36]
MSSSQSQEPPYLWAVGEVAAQKIPGTIVESDRYQVIAPHIWSDTRPHIEPYVSALLPDEALPYLHLYAHRIHIPQVYGFCRDDETDREILLLENVPLKSTGDLQPAIFEAWTQASAVRQVYWLWQILQLWNPLLELNVASSLLSPDNLRVEGWRVRLKELIKDSEDPIHARASFLNPDLSNLGQCWLVWVSESKATIADSLMAICAAMQQEASFQEVSAQLNQLLIEQSAQLPLRLQVVGATDVGRVRSHNEDTCYPLTVNTRTEPHDELSPRLAIVCDGIGGHEGGEVASQLAVQSIQLQIKALLTEIAQQSEPMPPDLLAEQLAAIVRVVNNLISTQNDDQERESRRRMGTTLVMALQIPQRVKLPGGAVANNAHELYLVNVGDSRAYWITQNYCHQLTVDDDVTTREIKQGRSLYREMLKRADAGSLTQALGTRDGQFLNPSVQRFILEEDGLLLLCSDGLSDNGLVEQSWREYANLVFREKVSLESAVQSWIDQANQKNGHDNTSIVLTHCHVSSPLPEIRLPGETKTSSLLVPPMTPEVDLSLVTESPKQKKATPVMLTVIILMLILSGVGLWIWRANPVEFQQLRDSVEKRLR